MTGTRAALALAVLSLAACTPTAALMTPPPTVNPPAGQSDETTGGVAFSAGGAGSSVSYGPWQVKGAGTATVSVASTRGGVDRRDVEVR